MIVLDEEDARQLMTPAHALEAVRNVFVSIAAGTARNYPVVREKLPDVGGTFGVKSGVDLAKGIVGLKAGGYWAGNEARGIKNHQSTTLLCDATSGQPSALVAANHLTALRTAAAAALATELLARTDVETLGVIGAGAQAMPHIEAQAGVRPFQRVIVASRDPRRAKAVAEAAQRFIPDSKAADFRTTTEAADVLLTLTPATEPVVLASWVRPGTHVNAMGADTAGKCEIEPALLGRARVFYDVWEQARTIGECQGAIAGGLLTQENAGGTLGDLLHGNARGRQSTDEITLFDSTGVALQDIAIAAMLVSKAREMQAGT